MKPLVLILLLVAPIFTSAADYKLKEGLFTIEATLRTGSTTAPAFKLNGSVLWMESQDPYESPKAEITIRRKTYQCDDTYQSYNGEHECYLYGPKVNEILDDIINPDPNFLAARDLIKRYFDQGYYYQKFTIPLGKTGQKKDKVTNDDFADPDNEQNAVDFLLTTPGMTAL